jgi:pimeloyl-ACP methyl ester carboxylesterase
MNRSGVNQANGRPSQLTIALILFLGFLLFSQGCGRKQIISTSPEQLVHARASDDILNGGVLFAPTVNSNRPIAIIWIHGWGVNFYQPTYVNIGRALAQRGYPCIVGNTRMHDLGNVSGYRSGKRLRGGGYWGVASDQALDLAAWIDFAESRGFKRVVLVGHSAGWAAVRLYQAQKQDPRVAGVVNASGAVRAEMRTPDPGELAQATRMMAENRPDDLVRITNRPYPSFISAATFMDIANMPPEYKDFFGMATTNAAVTRVRCPLLVWFGARESAIGTEEDLQKLKAAVQRLPSGPSRVDTVMIRGADHMYEGKETEVAQILAGWIETVISPEAVKSDAQPKQ